MVNPVKLSLEQLDDLYLTLEHAENLIFDVLDVVEGSRTSIELDLQLSIHHIALASDRFAILIRRAGGFVASDKPTDPSVPSGVGVDPTPSPSSSPTSDSRLGEPTEPQTVPENPPITPLKPADTAKNRVRKESLDGPSSS